MKKNTRLITNTLLGLGLVAGLMVGCASQKGLNKEAKLSKADAEKIAMDKVPNGTIKEAELERENGHLQWSFDMAAPGQASGTVTEVNIDAITGDVISIGTEKDDD
jgi:uncharacterized membrane protein YkoI